MKRFGYVLCFLLLLSSAFTASAAEAPAERYAIIIGTYTSQLNADRQLRQLEKAFGEKPVMVQLQEENGFDYVSEPVGAYIVVAIKPIIGREVLDKVYAEARGSFPDLYVSHATNVIAIEYEAPSAEPAAPSKVEPSPAPALPAAKPAQVTRIPTKPVQEIPLPAKPAASVVQVPAAPAVTQPAPKKPAVPVKPAPVPPSPAAGMDDLMLYGGAAAVVLLLIIVLMLMRRKRSAAPHATEEEPPLVAEEVPPLMAEEPFETVVEEEAEILEASEATVEVESAEAVEAEAFAPEAETFPEPEGFEVAEEIAPAAEEAVIEEEVVEAAVEPAEAAVPEAEEVLSGRKKRDYKRGMEPITKENFKIFEGVRLLVAEDNMINQKVINGLLADTGIEIVMANDGKEAVDTLEKDQNFQMVLMDAHMPIMDGFEATRVIRADTRFEHIPIIALSGDTGADDIRNMMEAGMEGTLEKPLHMDALYEMMYNFCDIDLGEEEGEDEEEIELLPDTPELHAEKGLDISMGDEALYKEILNEFVQMYANSDEQLHDFMIKDQTAEANALLLDVHGIAANIGADRLAECADRLREVLMNHDEKEYGELYKEYASHLKAVLRDIEKI